MNACRILQPARAAVCLSAVLAVTSGAALAQDKTVAVEAIPSASPFVLFGQWVERVASPWPSLQVESAVVGMPFAATASVQPTPYEAQAVILGQPELPLVGQAAAQAAQQWNAGFNYQGLQVSYLVVDARGKAREIRPVAKGLLPGERFRIRYTATFDAVAMINKVTGSAWNWQQAGTAWPKGGTAVQSAAGETVELPLDAGTYFTMGSNPNERFLLQVRHPNAKDQARSDQPSYRQDGARGSQYLQLVPTNTYPYFEQALAGAGSTR